MLSLELTLRVDYNLNGEDGETMRQQLERAVQHLTNNGLLTGETAAEVEKWTAVIENVDGCHHPDCDRLYGGECSCGEDDWDEGD
jgi:hypothetical protein